MVLWINRLRFKISRSVIDGRGLFGSDRSTEGLKTGESPQPIG